MKHFPASPFEMTACIWRNRSLIAALVKRDVLSRYRGSILGTFWLFLSPVLMLAVYTFVFSGVFEGSWRQGSESGIEFALVLYVGLICFNLFSECLTRAPSLIIANSNYVKKISFPLEILPLVNVISASYQLVANLLLWLIGYLAFVGAPHLSAFLVPLVLIPFMMFSLGLTWLFASLGVFFRDVSQVVGIVITIMMFLTPIFYPASAISERYRYLLDFNPLATVVEVMRGVLCWGAVPDPLLFGMYWISSVLIAWVGFYWFQKTRKAFADVL
jgi:lipopolysaccharide transport system permease protein